MSNHVQLMFVALIVGIASCYLARMTWRAWTKGKKGCGGGCGCGTPPKNANANEVSTTRIPLGDLTLRRKS